MNPYDYGVWFKPLQRPPGQETLYKSPTKEYGFWHVYYCKERIYNLRIFKAQGVWQVRIWNSDSLEEDIDHAATWEDALTNALNYIKGKTNNLTWDGIGK